MRSNLPGLQRSGGATLHPARLLSPGLRHIALFEGLPDVVTDALARECVWRRYPAGKQIIAYGALDRDVYLVASGRVRVSVYSMSGRQITFREHGVGDLFGEIAAVDGLKRFGDVVALERTVVACVPPRTFWRLLRAHPVIAERMLKRLASLVRQLSSRLIDLSTLSVACRIRVLLLRMGREAGTRGNCARIVPALRHAAIAGLVGTNREQVTRELSVLARLGIIERDRGALIIRDVAGLARLVEQEREM